MPVSMPCDIPSWLGRLMQVADSLSRAKKSPDARKQDKTAPGDRGRRREQGWGVKPDSEEPASQVALRIR